MSTSGMQAWWRTVRKVFGRGRRSSDQAYEDLLRTAATTQSLESLLSALPVRICEALGLSTFHLLLQQKDGAGRMVYRTPQRSASHACFDASSATVARMRRTRWPTRVGQPSETDARDAWQLLASDAELQALRELDAQLLFPLEGRTGLAGFAAISRPEHRPFSDRELRFLRDLGPQLGRGLETALLLEQLSQQAVQHETAQRELALAREVQEHLLPPALPPVAGLEFAALYRSAGQIGGDYYDVIALGGEHVFAMVADVSGKGIPAALLMATLRASLHNTLALGLVSLPAILARLNDMLYRSSSAGQYASLFLCRYDVALERLAYCNAGHPAPLVLRETASLVHDAEAVQRLPSTSTVIGLFPAIPFYEETVAFVPGCVLLAYSDGVSEAVDPSGNEWLDEGLGRAVRGAALFPVDRLVATVESALIGFVDGAPQHDDITVLSLGRPADASSPGPSAM